jgi:hypothetical protein
VLNDGMIILRYSSVPAWRDRRKTMEKSHLRIASFWAKIKMQDLSNTKQEYLSLNCDV